MAHDFKAFPELSNSQLETLRFESPHMQIEEDFEAVVVKVHDADTITLSVDFRDFDFPLRFLGIDAPELNAGGAVARDWLKGQLQGEHVSIMIDKNNRVGKYGRLLGRVFSRGMDMGETMLRMGLVTTFELRREGQIVPTDKLFRLGQWF